MVAGGNVLAKVNEEERSVARECLASYVEQGGKIGAEWRTLAAHVLDMNAQGESRLSVAQVERITGLSESSVKKAHRSLQRRGVIERLVPRRPGATALTVVKVAAAGDR